MFAHARQTWHEKRGMQGQGVDHMIACLLGLLALR